MKHLKIAVYTYTGYRVLRGVLLFAMIKNQERIHDSIFRRTYKFLYGEYPKFTPPDRTNYRVRTPAHNRDD